MQPAQRGRWGHMGRIKDTVLYILYPPKCIFCRSPLPRDALASACTGCANGLPYCLSAPCCKICGKPLASDAGHGICPSCRQDRNRPYQKIRSVFLYQGTVRDAVIRYKGSGSPYYGAAFAVYLAALAQSVYADVSFGGVLAVAPRRQRMKRKGFDQAAYLARALAKRLSLPYCGRVLYQKEERRKQSELHYAERWENVHGNIAVRRPSVVKGKVLLLVDDVCTTGATLRENAAVLIAAGAAAVYGITVATVPRAKSE